MSEIKSVDRLRKSLMILNFCIGIILIIPLVASIPFLGLSTPRLIDIIGIPIYIAFCILLIESVVLLKNSRYLGFILSMYLYIVFIGIMIFVLINYLIAFQIYGGLYLAAAFGYSIFFTPIILGFIHLILKIFDNKEMFNHLTPKPKSKTKQDKFNQYLELFNRTYNKKLNNLKQKARDFKKWLKDNDYDLT